MSKRFVRWTEQKDIDRLFESMGWKYVLNPETGAYGWENPDNNERMNMHTPKYLWDKFVQKSCFDQEDLLQRLEDSIKGVKIDKIPDVIKEFMRSEMEDLEKTKVELGIKNIL